MFVLISSGVYVVPEIEPPPETIEKVPPAGVAVNVFVCPSLIVAVAVVLSTTTSAGSGTGLKVTVVVDGSSAITVTVTYGGANYADNEVITISDAVLGNGGGADLTCQVASLHQNNACSSKSLRQLYEQNK